MRCPYCNCENHDDARFCIGCGQSLVRSGQNNAADGFARSANPGPGKSIEYSDRTGYSSVEQYGEAFSGAQNTENGYYDRNGYSGSSAYTDNSSYIQGSPGKNYPGKKPKKKIRPLYIIIPAAVLAAAIIAVILVLVFNNNGKSDSEQNIAEAQTAEESETASQEETSAPEETEEETSKEAVAEEQLSDIEMYGEILDIFYEGISTGWEYYESADSELVSYMWYTYDIASELSDAGYAFVDIDANGTDELIVALASDEDTSVIYDLYTYYDGEIIHLVAASERSEYRLCTNEDGEYFISCEGSSGASEGGTVYYTISPVLAAADPLIQAERVWYEYTEGSTLPAWYYEDSDGEETSVTADEAQEIMDSYTDCPFELTPLSIYSSDSSV